MNFLPKVLRQSVGFMSVVVALIGGAAMLVLVIAGNAAVAITLTPWLLILTVPVGLVVLGLWMALGNTFMEWAVDWGDREPKPRDSGSKA